MINDGTLWSILATGSMWVGAENTGAFPFLGIIHDIQIGHYIGTEQEHLDNYNGTTWDWHNDAIVDLKMGSAQISGTDTLDSTANGCDAAMVGATQVGEHINFDGSNDYMTMDAACLGNVEQTIAIEFWPNFKADDGVSYVWLAGDTNPVRVYKQGSDSTLRLYCAGVSIANIPFSTYGEFWIQNGRNSLVISFKSGTSNAWLNGHQILVNDATTYTLLSSGVLYVGRWETSAFFFNGNMTRFMVIPKILTATQRLDLDCMLLNATRWNR